MKIFVVTFFWSDDGGGRYNKVPYRRDMKFFHKFDDAFEYSKRYDELGWHGADITEEEVQ
jgi:hypothetical protein